MTILFVCSGNMHRSPLAAAMLEAAIRRDGRTDLEVVSAGTLAITGAQAVAEARERAAADGLDLGGHRSRPLTGEEVARADMILVMERGHLEEIVDLDASAAARCRLLGDYAGPGAGLSPGEDIPDGVGGDPASFDHTYRILRSCVERLYRELPPAPQEVYARAVEERLGRMRGRPLSLSPADFDLIERWWDRGVPLWIITESIDEIFAREGRIAAAQQVRRLAFLAPLVEARHDAWRRSLDVRGPAAAGGGARPDEASGEPEPDLFRAASRILLEAARQAEQAGLGAACRLLDAAARGLTEGAPTPDRAAAVLRLHGLEEELVAALRAATDPDQLAALSAAAESRLADHRARMTPAAFQATVSRLVDEGIRRRYGLPRLADGALGALRGVDLQGPPR